MFKFFWGILKLGIFAVIVLILGNTIRIGGKTVNDQIQMGMSQAERVKIPKASEITNKAVEKLDETQSSERARLKKLIESFQN